MLVYPQGDRITLVMVLSLVFRGLGAESLARSRKNDSDAHMTSDASDDPLWLQDSFQAWTVAADPAETRNIGDLARKEASEAVDALFSRAFDLKDANVTAELFGFLGRVSRYSLFNLGMAKMQRPGCAAIATEKRWLQLHRRVKAGSIPIVILRPGGPIMLVYEVADTEGPVLPQGWDEVTGKASASDYDRLKRKAAKEDAIAVREMPLGYNRAGDVRHAIERGADGVTRFTVRISEHQDHTRRFVTLAHELAHIYCGHLGSFPGCAWSDRSAGRGRAEKEFEAEGTSYLVARRAGLETRSAEYLAGYAQACDRSKISIDTVLNAAARIETFWRPAGQRSTPW